MPVCQSCVVGILIFINRGFHFMKPNTVAASLSSLRTKRFLKITNRSSFLHSILKRPILISTLFQQLIPFFTSAISCRQTSSPPKRNNALHFRKEMPDFELFHQFSRLFPSSHSRIVHKNESLLT